MKSLIALLCITLAVFVSPSLWANTDEMPLLDDRLSNRDPHFPIDFSWLTNRYNFDQIEEYADEFYGNHYKSWERYLTGKQREFAGIFGLSNIFFRVNLKNYDETKIVLSRKLLSGRVLLKYTAPVGDISDCELYLSLKPHRIAKIVGRGHINGEKSIAILINRHFGSNYLYKAADKRAAQRTRKLLGRVSRALNCD